MSVGGVRKINIPRRWNDFSHSGDVSVYLAAETH